MNNILVATDFSKHSKRALQSVMKLVEKTEEPCRIVLLNTYLVKPADPREIISLNDELKGRSRVGLEIERLELLRGLSNPKITIEMASRMGSLANVIQLYLLEQKIDLVAMGNDTGKNIDDVRAILKVVSCPLLLS